MGINENDIYIFFLNNIFLRAVSFLIDNISNMKDLSYIFLNIVLGVSAYKGLGYLKTFKEKKDAATFTFWMHLRIRMMEIRAWLQDSNSLINHLFTEETRLSWESESPEDEERIKTFQKLVKETICFIKEAPDQIPAYSGWTYDYNKLVNFLNDIIQFDICNEKEYFKYKEIRSIKERNDYCEDICMAIERMCKGIEDKQIKVEESINS